MIYKAVEVIWIFLAGGRDGRADGTGIEGSIRDPRGPKKVANAGTTGLELLRLKSSDLILR